MQESAQAAMSYVRSKAEEYGIPTRLRRARPTSTSTCPRAPSRRTARRPGITLATALVSALTRVPMRRDVAMTGEITLRGKVLPIGGVKEKVLAAHRAGLKTIILPKDNEKDLADIPKNVLDALDIYMVETMDEVLKTALAGPLPTPAPRLGRRRRAASHRRRRHHALRATSEAGDRRPEAGARAANRTPSVAPPSGLASGL